MPLTLTPLQKVPLIQPGDDLTGILLAAIQTAHIQLDDNDILVVASKIISKAEGRQVNLQTVKPSDKAVELSKRAEKDARLMELILSESNEVLRVQPGTIIVEHRLGFVCANAGIDHSNVCSGDDKSEDCVLLLPQDPNRSALEIRQKLKLATGCRLGILIIDSHGRAWRQGVVGMCIGLSGMPSLVDRRGWQDLFGFRLKVTTVAAADDLAAAASLIMGETSERIPAVHVRGFPYPLREGSFKELLRPKEQDLFR